MRPTNTLEWLLSREHPFATEAQTGRVGARRSESGVAVNEAELVANRRVARLGDDLEPLVERTALARGQVTLQFWGTHEHDPAQATDARGEMLDLDVDER